MVFIDENPDTVPHNNVDLINFSKRKLIHNVISGLQRLQQTSYNLRPVYQIVAFLKKLPSVDDQTLYQKSLAREPRKAKIQDIE